MQHAVLLLQLGLLSAEPVAGCRPVATVDSDKRLSVLSDPYTCPAQPAAMVIMQHLDGLATPATPTCQAVTTPDVDAHLQLPLTSLCVLSCLQAVHLDPGDCSACECGLASLA